ncbi:S-layer homology domain-containing protein [Paenibacillaceae bacterium WGS1546]|uniref:RCC1 domain-containing protein n=1 Tax=Cohnella sp. WGS1546 TaxID=3366810 RepID=UPI00372CFDBC
MDLRDQTRGGSCEMDLCNRKTGRGAALICVVFLLMQTFMLEISPGKASAQGSAHPSLGERWGGIQQISGGRTHTLALTPDGEVLAWGSNQDGKATVPIAAQSNIVSVSAGQDHSLALTSAGEVIAWGGGRFGQADVPLEAKSDIVAIASGTTAFHSLALTSSGKVIAWGDNTHGVSDVPDEAERGVVAIAAGYWHSLALTAAGEVVAWGGDPYGWGLLNIPDEVQGQAVAISAGTHHSLALTASGKVVAWGSNDYGQSSVPTEAESGVVAIAAGLAHSLALKSDGSVIAWGISDDSRFDDYGQTVIPEAARSGVIAIAAGYNYSLALKADGTIVAWGDNRWGQIEAPARLAAPVKPRQVAAGVSHSLALTSAGRVIGWGSDSFNQLPVPENLHEVQSISSGVSHSLALKTDGTISGWGDDVYNQLDIPTNLRKVVAIDSGDYHTLALQDDGTVVAWGRVYGDEEDKRLEVPGDLADAIAVGAGLFHSLALKADGTVAVWGGNRFNQLNIPSDLRDVKAISAGGYHSLALKTDGTIVAWGDHTYNQLNLPDRLQDVVAVSAGRHHSVALKSDGTVVAWGSNTYRQLEVPLNLRNVVAISAGDNHTLALRADGTVVGWGSEGSGKLDVPTSDLAWIELTDQSGEEVELPFDVDQQEYTVQIDDGVNEMNVQAVLEFAEYADVYVNGERPSDPAEGVKIQVTDEQTIVNVEVSPYLKENKTYTIALVKNSAPPEQVAKPTANPAGRAVPAGTKVILETLTEGATIYYTTDGSAPTSGSTEYLAPIEVTGEMTIQAIAAKDGLLDSEVMSESYTIAAIPAPANLTALAGDRSVTLTWNAVTGIGSVTYAVYQTGGSSAPVDPAEWSLVQSVAANVYTVTGLTNGQAYSFAVKTIHTEGTSDFSNAATAIPRAAGGSSGSGGGGWSLSGNASLKILEAWADGTLVALTPSFAADTYAYMVRTDAKQIEIKAAAEHPAAKVTWKDQTLGDGILIDLSEGDNVIPLTVQAEDGSRKTYTLTIERVTTQPAEPIEPAEPDKPTISFADIAGHWAEGDIKRAAAAGIVNGYPDGTFKPNDPVTRAEFTVMLAGALKLEEKGVELAFTDEALIGAWAKQAVAHAVQAGIVIGNSDGSFRPNAQIIRAEMAVMIARALKLQTDAGALTGYADDDTIPRWARGAVEAIRELGIVNGRGGNRFAPNETATRAEATAMLLRMLQL